MLPKLLCCFALIASLVVCFIPDAQSQTSGFVQVSVPTLLDAALFIVQ